MTLDDGVTETIQSLLLDAPVQDTFDRYTRLARTVIGAPVSLITLLDEDRQFFLSCDGLADVLGAARETPLTHSFCQYVIQTAAPLVVEDARAHAELSTNRAIEDLNVVAYLGVPLLARNGVALGSYCVIDAQPRQWSDRDVEIMKEMAILVASEMETQAAARAADERHARSEALLNSVADGIYALDTNGICIYANAQYCEMFGYSIEELMGRDLHLLTHHTRADGTPYPTEQCPIVRARCNGEGVVVDDEVMWRKDGTPLPVEYVAYPIRTDEGVVGAAVRITDIAMRKEREEQLSLQQALLAAQAEALLDAMLIVAEDGTRLWANRRFNEMWNFPPDVIASGSDERMRKWARTQLVDPEGFERRITEIHADRYTPARDEIVLADGRVYDRYGGPVVSPEGVYYGHLWLFREITEIKQTQKEREEVMAIVSHDLRNPFSTIFTSATVLLEIPLGEDARTHQLQIIRRTAQAGTRLIQNLLDVSRIEAGRLLLDCTDVKVAELITAAVELSGGAALDKQITLEPRLPPADVVVSADRDRMLQVLSNLIANAVKFTPHGGRIVVGAALEKDQVRFTVEDNGEGISADVLPHIFDRYWQTRNARRAGAGLGLSIVKGIIQAHKGEVHVRSEPGHGSTFEFVLPR